MRVLIVLLALVLQQSLLAQDDFEILEPFDPHGDHQTWAVKAKGFFYPLGDWLGLGAGVGAEYGFCKRHSIGADLFIHRLGGSYDAFTDTNGVEHPDGGTFRRLERAIIVNYRYYLGCPGLRKKYWIPYVSAFARYGTIDESNDPEYAHLDIERHDIHRSAGVLFGLIALQPEARILGIDMNVGLFYKWKDKLHYDMEYGQLVPYPSTQQKIGVRVDVNLSIMLFRKRSSQGSAGMTRSPRAFQGWGTGDRGRSSSELGSGQPFVPTWCPSAGGGG